MSYSRVRLSWRDCKFQKDAGTRASANELDWIALSVPRMVAIALVALVLAAVWAELAVGLFD